VHGFESTGTWLQDYRVYSFEGTGYIVSHYPNEVPIATQPSPKYCVYLCIYVLRSSNYELVVQ